jgi:TrmH family RNA methyltransferase
MRITSSANPRIKWLRKLRERKFRHESGCFYAEGLRILVEAARQGVKFETLVVSPELLTSPIGLELAEDQRHLGTEVLEVTAGVFESFALKDAPVGLAGVIRQQWLPLEEIHPGAGDSWVALDEIADPGNLGTILRTHDAVGGKGVILLGHATDPYDPSAARASMGALFSQRLVKASFEEFSAWKKRLNIPLIGTSDSAQVDYQEIKYPTPMVLLMGSERQGLAESSIRLCDSMVRIPMAGSSDSLNLAVATGVILYEIFNQRRNLKERA